MRKEKLIPLDDERKTVCIPDGDLLLLLSELPPSPKPSDLLFSVFEKVNHTNSEFFLSFEQIEKLIFASRFKKPKIRAAIEGCRDRYKVKKWALHNRFGVGYRCALDSDIVEESYKSGLRSISHIVTCGRYSNIELKKENLSIEYRDLRHHVSKFLLGNGLSKTFGKSLRQKRLLALMKQLSAEVGRPDFFDN